MIFGSIYIIILLFFIMLNIIKYIATEIKMDPIKPVNRIARTMLMDRQGKQVVQSKKIYNRKKSNDTNRKENTKNDR